MPPMREPEKLPPPEDQVEDLDRTAGLAAAPTCVSVPSRFNNAR